MAFSQRRLGFTLVILASALVLTGCGKTATERATERAVEQATNGQADVDVDQGSVTINTNGSSWTVGESVKLPSDFPTDVYVVDGTIKSAIKTEASNAFSVVISSTQTIAAIKALYDTKLKDDGWTTTATASVSGNEMITADKGNRTLQVTIGTGDEANTTAVSLTVLNKTDVNAPVTSE